MDDLNTSTPKKGLFPGILLLHAGTAEGFEEWGQFFWRDNASAHRGECLRGDVVPSEVGFFFR